MDSVNDFTSIILVPNVAMKKISFMIYASVFAGANTLLLIVHISHGCEHDFFELLNLASNTKNHR